MFPPPEVTTYSTVPTQSSQSLQIVPTSTSSGRHESHPTIHSTFIKVPRDSLGYIWCCITLHTYSHIISCCPPGMVVLLIRTVLTVVHTAALLPTSAEFNRSDTVHSDHELCISTPSTRSASSDRHPQEIGSDGGWGLRSVDDLSTLTELTQDHTHAYSTPNDAWVYVQYDELWHPDWALWVGGSRSRKLWDTVLYHLVEWFHEKNPTLIS